MIREHELIARFTSLEQHVLVAWIEDGVIAPHQDEAGYLFDRLDEARVALACDLHYRMGLENTSLPVIMTLMDQLHEARSHLRALARAVSGQPDAVQSEIGRLLADARKISGTD